MLAQVPPRAPAFAFLDPEGSELEWPTVEAITAHKRGHSPNKIEQLILFPVDMGFVRLAPDHPDLVTRIYGHDRWIDISERRHTGQIVARPAIPITHYRIPSKQQPAATPRLVANQQAGSAARAEAVVARPHRSAVTSRVGIDRAEGPLRPR
jgi:hypothetical protein